MLPTETADSLNSPEKDARIRIQAYKKQSVSEKLVKSGLDAFLAWLPVARKTTLAKEIITTSSERELYDDGIFMNHFTGLAATRKYVPFSIS